MARINFAACGFVDRDDPRNYLPDCIRPLIPGQYSSSFQLTPLATFNFCWRWAQLHYDFNISWSDGTSNAGITASGDFVASWLFGILHPDESSIRCQTELIYAIRALGSPAGTEMNFQMQLGDFNEISELFTYGVTGQFRNSLFGDLVAFYPTANASGVICTVLGENVPMFDVVGTASGSVTITLSPLDAWWPYDNHKGGGPPNGPIWDKDTGDQLIVPIPGGL